MEYCDGGDFSSKIKRMQRQRLDFKEQFILCTLSQLLMALRPLHLKRILHRDIKAQNIFLTKDETRVMMGDFGISKVIVEIYYGVLKALTSCEA